MCLYEVRVGAAAGRKDHEVASSGSPLSLSLFLFLFLFLLLSLLRAPLLGKCALYGTVQ